MKRFVLLAALALAACGQDATPDYQARIDPGEREFGAEQHPQLLAEFGGAYQGSQAAYVERVGEKIADAAGLGGQCTFTLVNTDVVNAFAVPGCYVYVTRGLLAIVNSEGELASILGHELGHVVAQHSQRRQRQGLLTGLGAAAIGLITGSDRLANFAGRAAQFFTLRYSREQEYESDDLGIRYLRAAGYDPFAAAGMLDSLSDNEAFQQGVRGAGDAKAIPEWALTHPLTANRIARARDTAEATGIPEDQLPENESAYLDAVDGLLFGDDPEQGFVLGRRFAHPVMRISFEAPPGFSLTNSPQAVLIDGPDGLQGEFAGGPMPNGGPSAYAVLIAERLSASVPAQAGTPERRVIGGVEAAVLPMQVQAQDGSTATILIAAYDGGRGAGYHFILVSPGATTAGAEALINSFRLLSAQEAATLRPRVIDVVQAPPNATAQTFAARMATAPQPLAQFLTLNDRDEGDAIAAGERVKVVRFR